MFVAEVKLVSDWKDASFYGVTFDADQVYNIVNCSADTIYLAESEAEPAETVGGVPIAPGSYATYKKGAQTLYFRNGYAPVKMGDVPTQDKVSNVSIYKVG